MSQSIIDKLSMNKFSLEQTFSDNNTGEILKENNIKLVEPTFRFKNKGNRYTKSFHCIDLDLSKSTYYKYFHYIERRIEMGTNRIVKHTQPGEKNIPITKEELCELVGAKERTINDFLNECIDKNYIALMEINKEFFGYIVNPIYMVNGNNLNIFLYIIFSKDEKFKSYIPEEDIKKMDTYLSLVSKV